MVAPSTLPPELRSSGAAFALYLLFHRRDRDGILVSAKKRGRIHCVVRVRVQSALNRCLETRSVPLEIQELLKGAQDIPPDGALVLFREPYCSGLLREGEDRVAAQVSELVQEGHPHDEGGVLHARFLPPGGHPVQRRAEEWPAPVDAV